MITPTPAGAAAGARRVAVITGAARGIGAAIAERFAASGHAVVLVDRCADDPALPYPLATEAELHATADRCADVGASGVAALVADVRDQHALDAVVAGTVEQFGRIDIAVGAAGAIAGGPPGWETTDAEWEAMIDINLTGVWRLARATIPAMLAAPGPATGRRFVAIASAASTTGLPQLAAYSAAKHGVLGLVRALAAETASTGPTVNAVCPGSTSTAMLDASAEIYDLASPTEFASHQAMGRLITPAEIADAVVFLCSPAASAITGIALPVDAGFNR